MFFSCINENMDSIIRNLPFLKIFSIEKNHPLQNILKNISILIIFSKI